MQELLHIIEEYHDSYTKIHEDKVGKLMRVLGQAMGLDKAIYTSLEEAGSLHDIGKLAIPPKILEKPGPLTVFEREVIEFHVEFGHKIIQKIKHPMCELASRIILTHHEAYDGSGYPNHLKGEQIPLEGRLCCICDIYDALRAARPYRRDLTHENVIQIMQYKGVNGLGNKFDPEILEVFINIKDQYMQFYNDLIPSTISTTIDPSHR